MFYKDSRTFIFTFWKCPANVPQKKRKKSFHQTLQQHAETVILLFVGDYFQLRINTHLDYVWQQDGVGLSQNKLQCVCVHDNDRLWPVGVFLIAFQQQWSSVAQRKKTYQTLID